MGLFRRKNKKIEQEKEIGRELTDEELEKVTAGNPGKRDWCPKVDVAPINAEELTDEELENVRGGIPKHDER